MYVQWFWNLLLLVNASLLNIKASLSNIKTLYTVHQQYACFYKDSVVVEIIGFYIVNEANIMSKIFTFTHFADAFILKTV